MSDKRYTCLLVDTDTAWLTRAVQELWDSPTVKVVGTALSLEEARQSVDLARPTCIVVGEALGIEAIETLAKLRCAGWIIWAVGAPTPDAAQEAMTAGARGILQRGRNATDLPELLEAIEARQAAPPATPEKAPTPALRIQVPRIGKDRSADGPRPPLGKVLAVLGASGGAGRTTAAANLAAALAAAGNRVSALDLSVRAPALTDHLGLRSYAPERWQALLRGESPAVVLVPGAVEGVRVFPGPSPSEMSAVLTAAEPVRRLINQLRLEDDFIILDTPGSPFDPFAAAAFEEANIAAFTTGADMSATKRLAAALTGPWSGGAALKVLIVTRVRPEIGRDAEAVARELAVRPNLVISDNPQLYWPSTAGSPVALSNTPDGHGWRKLASLLAERAAAAAGATAVHAGY